MVYSRGDRSQLADTTVAAAPGLGFFIEGLPSIYYSRIVAVREDGTVDLIDSDERLAEFLGPVDNWEEIYLHIMARGYGVDSDTLIGGAYKEEEDRYLLYLQKWSGAPVSSESVKAVLYKDGRFEELGRARYHVSDLIIMS